MRDQERLPAFLIVNRKKMLFNLTRSVVPMTIKRLMLLASALTMLFLHRAEGQLNFSVRIISVQPPSVVSWFQAYCNGGWIADIKPSELQITEDGFPVKNMTIDNDDPNKRRFISLMLLAQNSTSMDSIFPFMKNTVRTYIDSMGLLNGAQNDAVEVRTYRDTTIVDAMLTTNKPTLHSTINNLATSGTGRKGYKALYDAVWRIASAPSSSNFVVVWFTNSNEPSHGLTKDYLLELVTDLHIPLYVFDFSPQPDSSVIVNGSPYWRYYFRPSNLQSIFATLYQEHGTLLHGDWYESSVHFDTKCPDGSVRTVQFTLTRCGTSKTVTKSYRAKVDTAQWHNPVSLRLGDDSTYANGTITIPFFLETPIQNKFRAATFDLLFDKQLLAFTGVMKDGGYFKDLTIMTESLPNGVRITTDKTIWIDDPGLLCAFNFKTLDPDADATATVSISQVITQAPITQTIVPCSVPTFFDGTIKITSRKPRINACDISAPDEFIVYRYATNYDPPTATVSVQVANDGDREVKNARADLVLEPSVFKLAGQQQFSKALVPPTIPPGGSGLATFEIVALPRTAKATFPITLTVASDNHVSVTCMKDITVPAIPPVLSMDIEPIRIVYDRLNARYTPMPFTLRARIKNLGYVPTNLTQAEIILPKGLALDASDTFAKKIASQSTLAHDEAGEVHWTLFHPITVEEKQFQVRVRSFAANADTIEEEITVMIPAFDPPQLECNSASLPTSVRFDSATKNYNTNPFTISFSALNTGGLDADSVRATLELPPGFVLVQPTQSFTQFFSPMKIERWNANLPPNVLQWEVRALPRYVSSTDTIRIRLNGITQLGSPMSETVCVYLIDIDAFGKTKMQCTANGQDSIFFSPLLGLSPNPFNVTFDLKNESLLPITLEQTGIVHNLQGIAILSLTPQISHRTLNAGEMVRMTARMKALPVLRQRIGTIFLDYSTREQLEEKILCAKTLFIDSSKIGPYPILSIATTSPDSLLYDCLNKRYEPQQFTLRASVDNSGNTNADSLEIRMFLPATLELVTPADSVQLIPVIDPVSSQQIVWNARVRTASPVNSMDEIRWSLRRRNLEVLAFEKAVYIADSICPAPAFSVSALSFQSMEDDSSQSTKEVLIQSGDGTPFSWIASTNVTWLQVAPAQGGSGEILHVTLQKHGLAPGDYSGNIRVRVPEFATASDLPVSCKVSASINEVRNVHAASFMLEQNFPNPFSERTTITFNVGKVASSGGNISFKIFDLYGREVLDLTNELTNGSSLVVTKSQLPGAGMYFYRLSTGFAMKTRAMILK